MAPKPGIEDHRLSRFWALETGGDGRSATVSTGDGRLGVGEEAWVRLVLDEEPVVLGEL